MAESLCAASLLGAAGRRSVSVRSGVSSARASDGGVCETLQLDSFPLLVAVEVGGAGADAVVTALDVIGRSVETAATTLGTVTVFVRLVVDEISISRLFPELAFPFTALVVAPSVIAGGAAAADATTTADDDTPLSDRISLSASDDCSWSVSRMRNESKYAFLALIYSAVGRNKLSTFGRATFSFVAARTQ